MNKLKSYAASRRGRDTLLSFGIVIAAFIIVQALIAGGMISSQIKGLLVPICAYVVMAISLNMTVGILGELSLATPDSCRSARSPASSPRPALRMPSCSRRCVWLSP